MAQLNPKTLPMASDLEGYSNWRADLEIWEMFTDLEKKKRGPTVFLSLTGQARECVRALGAEKINKEIGADLPTPLVWLGEPCYATDSLSSQHITKISMKAANSNDLIVKHHQFPLLLEILSTLTAMYCF